MKKNKLVLTGVLATLLVSSQLVVADTKYPAADFQPQVVFQDNELIEKNSSKQAASPSKTAASSETDAKYPAANFQPQVVYSDPNYKHNESTTAVSKKVTKSEAVAAEPVAEVSATAVAKEEQSDSSLYLILLAAAALGGVYFFKNQGKSKEQAPEFSAAPARAPGATGVGRYINKKAGTGVSRYLDKQIKTATVATGVAKYVAKQASTAKTKATEAATGVEKYMRNRG